MLRRGRINIKSWCTTSVHVIGGLIENEFPTTKVNKLNKSFQKELQAMNQFLQGDMKEMTSGVDERTREINLIKDMISKMHYETKPINR